MKNCSKCGQQKNLQDFYSQPKGDQGVTAECKECRRKRSGKWKKDNREQVNEAVRHYDWIYAGKKSERNQKFRDKNPDYQLEYRKRQDGNHSGRHQEYEETKARPSQIRSGEL